MIQQAKKKMSSVFGLRTKFLLAALAAQTLALGVAAFNTSDLIAKKVSEAADNGGKNYAFLLNATLSSYASAGRLKEMDSFMSETLSGHESTLAYVAVFDALGKRILAAGPAPNRLVKPKDEDIVPMIDSKEVAGGLRRSFSGDLLEASFPLLLKDGEIGTAVFGLRMGEYEELRKSLVYQELGAGALGLMLSVVLIQLLTRGMQKRIEALSKASGDVANGVFDKPLTVQGDDELAMLAHAFESMQLNIKAKIEDLSQASQAAIASEARFRSLFEKAPVPMLLVQIEDKNVNVDLANQAFVDLMGYGRESLGCDYNTWPLWQTGDAPSWNELKKKEKQIKIVCKKGSVLEVEAAAAEFDIGSGGWKALALSFVDNTQKMQAKRDLEHLNESLEARVKQRNADLTASNKELTGALQSLRVAQEHLVASEKLASLGALVAGVAHEMGTPIGNALLTSSALLEQTQKFEDQCIGGAVLKRSALKDQADRTLEACRIIGQSLESASSLLQSFKQVAVDRKSDTRRNYLLETVAKDTFASFESRLRKAKAAPPDLEFEENLRVEGYPGALSQILSNLITNSIVHGFENKEGGQLGFKAATDPSDGAMVIVEFVDNGNGMSENSRKKIFDPFFTTKLGKGGSGMGMNITHTLATGVMGGSIVVRSQEGRGAQVVMRFPKIAPEKISKPDREGDNA